MLSSAPSIPDIYLNYRGVFTHEQIQKLLRSDIARKALEDIEPCSFLPETTCKAKNAVLILQRFFVIVTKNCTKHSDNGGTYKRRTQNFRQQSKNIH